MLLQRGDILAYKDNGWIAVMSAGKYNHVAVVSKIKGDVIYIIESHLKSDGVVEVVLDMEFYKGIDVYRVPGGLGKYQKINLISGMRLYWVGQIPYDLPSFFSKFVRSTLGRLLGGKAWRKQEPLLNNKNAFDCMETVARGYKKFIGIKINSNVHVASGTPADIEFADGVKLIGKLTALC